MILYVFLNIIYIILYVYIGIISLNILFSWIPVLRDSKFGLLIESISNWITGYLGDKLSIGFLNFDCFIAIIFIEFICQIIANFI